MHLPLGTLPLGITLYRLSDPFLLSNSGPAINDQPSSQTSDVTQLPLRMVHSSSNSRDFGGTANGTAAHLPALSGGQAPRAMIPATATTNPRLQAARAQLPLSSTATAMNARGRNARLETVSHHMVIPILKPRGRRGEEGARLGSRGGWGKKGWLLTR
jgi:hypothetical protein